jgi:serine protease AprX
MDKKAIEQLFFSLFTKNNRFTQDSPVYPDVWLEYFRHTTSDTDFRADLILTPHRDSTAPQLLQLLSEGLQKHYQTKKSSGSRDSGAAEPPGWQLASTGESVAAKLNLAELIEVALPLTKWWQQYMWEKDDINLPREDQKWLKEVTGAIVWCSKSTSGKRKTMPSSFADYHEEAFRVTPPKHQPSGKLPYALWSVSKNRPAEICLDKSVAATKADASRRTFDIRGKSIVWAVLDTGIDAQHTAFRKVNPATKEFYTEKMGAKTDPHSNFTRILATYDFTRFRSLMGELADRQARNAQKPPAKSLLKKLIPTTSDQTDTGLSDDIIGETTEGVFQALKKGRMFDWDMVSSLLRIPHNITEYKPPLHDHGTHVAGIIAANPGSGSGKNKLVGMCPEIQLIDIRVLDGQGQGDEFNILAALQFVRWFNNRRGNISIHGINLSLSMIHEVANYACGQTPVCETCNRLSAEGTVVVAAAGNLGQTLFRSKDGVEQEGFRMVNITDPGNADGVITVGATHSNRPHSYGVSYFSSKGPTGDGRIKPDLVAPGEKIESAVLNDRYDRKDGTSMAAPHVSGAAALLLDKHRELIGQTDRVKQILCGTATDLGREKYFQGAGMLDVLRAIQSV